MKPAVLTILAFASLIAFCPSCKKSKDSATPPKTKTVLLTQSSWKIQSVGIDADKNGTVDQDITGTIAACQLDNIYTFKSDSTGIMDEAALKCNASDPQTTAFTWMFKNNATVLSGTFSFSAGDATVVSISDTAMIIAYDDDFGTAVTYHILVALKH